MPPSADARTHLVNVQVGFAHLPLPWAGLRCQGSTPPSPPAGHLHPLHRGSWSRRLGGAQVCISQHTAPLLQTTREQGAGCAPPPSTSLRSLPGQARGAPLEGSARQVRLGSCPLCSAWISSLPWPSVQLGCLSGQFLQTWSPPPRKGQRAGSLRGDQVAAPPPRRPCMGAPLAAATVDRGSPRLAGSACAARDREPASLQPAAAHKAWSWAGGCPWASEELRSHGHARARRVGTVPAPRGQAGVVRVGPHSNLQGSFSSCPLPCWTLASPRSCDAHHVPRHLGAPAGGRGPRPTKGGASLEGVWPILWASCRPQGQHRETAWA